MTWSRFLMLASVAAVTAATLLVVTLYPPH